MLLEKVKRRAIIKRSTQDLLGAALICASRRTNARKHLTIASVVKGLRSIGYDTSIARIMRALAIFKESGLYTHPAPPMEHLEDILSNLDLSRMPPSHVAASVEIAREVLLSASLQGLLTNPRTLAACSLYSGFKQVRVRSGNGLPRISFPMLAQASGLAEFTIRDSYERCFSKVTNA
jgi:transcription initiation factor TFIIIB Brf1 subunit/transcription initiation factor TFIIB